MSNQEVQAAEPVSPSMQMMQILWPGAMAVQAMHVAAKLALADLVAGGPRSIEELAEATHSHGPSMARFLRALTSLGIFAEDSTGRFRQTALSDTLRSDHPESIRPSAMMLGAHFIWGPSGELEQTVRTGQPAFERLYGAPFFEYLAGQAEDAAVFNAAMSSSPAYVAAIVGAYDFSKLERIVDVGGGHGLLLAGNPPGLGGPVGKVLNGDDPSMFLQKSVAAPGQAGEKGIASTMRELDWFENIGAFIGTDLQGKAVQFSNTAWSQGYDSGVESSN
jgi:O-methyltransferase domain/Dimerisation domain